MKQDEIYKLKPNACKNCSYNLNDQYADDKVVRTAICENHKASEYYEYPNASFDCTGFKKPIQTNAIGAEAFLVSHTPGDRTSSVNKGDSNE